MISRENVIEVLKQCYDPEIPINIWDMGLVYELNVEDDKVFVKMTLTSPACPAGQSIINNIKDKILSLDGIKGAKIELTFDPPWNPSKMSEEARVALGF